MRGGEGADLKRFRWYQDNILIPGIKAHRLKYGNFDSDSGAAIPDHLTAVSYCDVTCIQEGDCILTSSSSNFILCLSHPKRQGVYGYFDINRGCFVRSGKVTRRGFDARGSEHEKGAKALTASSHFYGVYPSRFSSRAGSREKQGFFESLQQVILVGFDPTSAGAQSFDKDVAEGGILLLDEDDKASILASMNTAEGRANPTPIQKFHDVISYQFEFGYDLAIAPELNVSRSPGFESILGIFGGSA